MPTQIGLVVAEFYAELADEMERQARENAAERDAEITASVRVPGVYDAPLAADRVARLDAVDAVVVLGAVVTGDTDHDQVVAHAAADKLADVSLDRDCPVAFGVTGPGMSDAEAHERIAKGANAVHGALDTLAALPE